jgi:hypothetical protein
MTKSSGSPTVKTLGHTTPRLAALLIGDST